MDNDFDFNHDPYDGDDLEALGQRESWEHEQGEREALRDEFEDDPHEGFDEDDFDRGDALAGEDDIYAAEW